MAAQEEQALKGGFDLAPYVHESERLRLQHLAATSGYMPFPRAAPPTVRQTYKQAFTIDNIIGSHDKHPSSAGNCRSILPPTSSCFTMNPLPAFASQFGSPNNINSHSLMMSYRALQHSDPDFISSIASTYGHMTGHSAMSAIEYYNTLKSLHYSPMLSTRSGDHSLATSASEAGQLCRSLPVSPEGKEPGQVQTVAKSKPLLMYSVEAILKHTKESSSSRSIDMDVDMDGPVRKSELKAPLQIEIGS